MVAGTGLPSELLHDMALYPERYGNTHRWRPFLAPLGGLGQRPSVDKHVLQNGLSHDVVEMVDRYPELFGTIQQVTAETGFPAALAHGMARHPD